MHRLSAIILLDKFFNSSKLIIIQRIGDAISEHLFEFDVQELVNMKNFLRFKYLNSMKKTISDVFDQLYRIKKERKALIKFFKLLRNIQTDFEAEDDI